MNFTFFKNNTPIFYYLISMFSFVFANLVGEKNSIIYLFLLGFGLLSFLVGLYFRITKK